MGLLLLPAGPPQQLANLSFFLAALASDVLLIRLFLVSRSRSWVQWSRWGFREGLHPQGNNAPSCSVSWVCAH